MNRLAETVRDSDRRDFIQVVNAQAELVKWWANPLHAKSSGTALLHAATGRPVNLGMAGERPWDGEYARLRISSPFYVTRDMTMLVEAAGKAMPTEPFRSTDPPVPHGFVYFAQPLRLSDDEGHVPARAFSWNREVGPPSATSAIVYSDRESLIENLPEAWRAMGSQAQQTLGPLVPSLLYVFKDDHEWAGTINSEFAPYVKALWAISQQRLARVVDHTVDRVTSRRLARLDMPAFGFKVVTLRRESSVGARPDDPQHVEWSHRWLVTGHWRNQYLPSVDSHRLQWIAGYVKGPENKPLILKPTVFRVAR